jgi:hypothetical protein
VWMWMWMCVCMCMCMWRDGAYQNPIPTVRYDASFTLRDNIQWAAVWDGASRGAVYQYPVGNAYTGRKGFWNSFWNRKYDHKLYLQMDVPTEKGAEFGCVVCACARARTVAPWYKHAKMGWWVGGCVCAVKRVAASVPVSPSSLPFEWPHHLPLAPFSGVCYGLMLELFGTSSVVARASVFYTSSVSCGRQVCRGSRQVCLTR